MKEGLVVLTIGVVCLLASASAQAALLSVDIYGGHTTVGGDGGCTGPWREL